MPPKKSTKEDLCTNYKLTELKDLAKNAGLIGYSRMNKADLCKKLILQKNSRINKSKTHKSSQKENDKPPKTYTQKITKQILPDLCSSYKVVELKEIAKKQRLTGYGKMNKAELCEKLVLSKTKGVNINKISTTQKSPKKKISIDDTIIIPKSQKGKINIDETIVIQKTEHSNVKKQVSPTHGKNKIYKFKVILATIYNNDEKSESKKMSFHGTKYETKAINIIKHSLYLYPIKSVVFNGRNAIVEIEGKFDDFKERLKIMDRWYNNNNLQKNVMDDITENYSESFADDTWMNSDIYLDKNSWLSLSLVDLIMFERQI